MTVADGTAVVIQIFLYSLSQLFNLLTDVGLIVESWKAPKLCDEVLSDGSTNANQSSLVKCSSGANFSVSALEDARTDAVKMSFTILVFTGIGVILFVVQVSMFLRYLIARRNIEFEHNIDNSRFLRNFYNIHGVVLAVEAILHDLAMGFIVVELCMLVWKEPNCWECEILAGNTPSEISLSKTNLWLGIKLVSLVPITLYKGMLPMFMWIGGPFCGMDCYICRVCVVIPAGTLLVVLLMTPICGAVILRLVPVASGIPNGAPDAVWNIGLIFWAMAIIVTTLVCSFCVSCCRTCCFKYGVCKWCGIDCFGLGAPKKKQTIKNPDA